MTGGEQPNQAMVEIASKRHCYVAQPPSLLVVVLVDENELKTEQPNDDRGDGPVHEDQLVVFIGCLLRT